MKIVTIHEAKTHLSRLIQEALSGEEIVIAKGSKSLVKLIPLECAKESRVSGTLPGLLLHMADDFDAPLEDFSEYMS
ncbi:type II toxin-antitoxin system prevent-host-death family antitoxin [bacterium]|nr:type II toxin-antitoxin system prevent-host-death family antitoxin [bacterium]